MGSPLEQAGATREPSEYAALSMDRAITGLWTQRSPLRDADVPYLYGKFYSASRFDSLIDGINREVSAELTYRRRPGSSVYNSNTFPAINSFYSYKRINSGVEIVRVIADGADGVIYDATAGHKAAIHTKAAGAGKARFQGVNTALYFCDGVENLKLLEPASWSAQTSLATTQYAVGTTVIDSNSNIEYLAMVNVGTVTNVALTGKVVAVTLSSNEVVPGMSFSVNVGTATFLNGKLLICTAVASGVVFAFFDHVDYVSAADTGSATTTDVGTLATTGGSMPTWALSYGNPTADGASMWINFGEPLFDWGKAAPSMAPNIAPIGDCLMVFWRPFTKQPALANTLLDSNGFAWVGGGGVTGGMLPKFAQPIISGGAVILGKLKDGSVNWTQGAWLGTTVSYIAPSHSPWQTAVTPLNVSTAGLANGDYCVDSNGNLEQAIGGSGPTGGSEPTWNTTYGGTTADNGLTWINRGPFLALSFQGRQYGYAYHEIDGSVSTLSTLSPSTNAVIEGVQVSGGYSLNLAVDAVWIFHTPDGTTTPLFLASIPNNTAGGTWTFNDELTDFALNAFIIGPQNEANNPPPLGMTAPLYHLGRIAAIYQNGVIMSGGPNTLVGNGNTAFPPANFFPIPEQPIRLFATITNAGPGLLVWGRANIYVILGQGTASNPFQSASIYMAGCGITNYDAVTQIGSTFYAFGNTALVDGKLVGKAFSLDPGAGYVEYGFPIGDQFANVTTGAGGKIPNSSVPLGYLYNPSSTFVTWAELGSGDTALYVADGSVGWFRYSPIASPESGFLWSPRAAIVGGTSAVQGVETQPGVTQLLIGPAAELTGQGTVNFSSLILTWTGGPKFTAAMVGQTVTLVGGGATSAAILGFISPTQLQLGAFLLSATTVTWSIGIPGPILFRDSAVNADWASGTYNSYPSYDVKGCIQLCLSGEVGEIAHVHVVSAAEGARPSVGLLFGEALATTAAPFAWYDRTCTEPPNLPPSQSLYSDRYTMLQNGVTPKCLFFQLGMDYGTQNFADETLMFSIFGAKYAERREQ